jgi:hypothetical protein
LAIAREKFKKKQNKFFNNELYEYELKLLEIEKQHEKEIEEVKNIRTPFKLLLDDLGELCKCPESKRIMVNPTSVPSGSVCDHAYYSGIIRREKLSLSNINNEDIEKNFFRSDKFTKRLSEIVEKHKRKYSKMLTQQN